MRNHVSTILIGIILIGIILIGTTFSFFSHPSVAASSNPTGLASIKDEFLRVKPGDPQWAIGAYSTTVALSTESSYWTNLPSSPGMAGVSFVAFMVNAPVAASGTVTANQLNYNIIGIMFQCADIYTSPTTNYPEEDVVFFVTRNSALTWYHYTPVWSNVNIGTGSMSQSVSYATHSSTTGWWCIQQGNYLGALNTTGYYTPDHSPTNNPGGFTWTLTSLASSTSVISYGTNRYNPSIAMEVSQGTSGNFFSDNPNFDAESNVGGNTAYYYGDTTINHFLVGSDPPPGGTIGAWGSGFTYYPGVGGTQYYDEHGTSAGIAAQLQNWYISNPSKVQGVNQSLPPLNSEHQYYLTMNSGNGGSVTPSSGYYMGGQQVQIHATANAGFLFQSWSGYGTGSYTGSSNPYTITMGGAITETANFALIEWLTMAVHQLSPNGDCGSITPSPGNYEYTYGQAVAISANAPSGCSWRGWVGTGTGSYSGSAKSTTIYMYSGITETASFYCYTGCQLHPSP